jgi:hypothetical protein
MEGLSNSYLTKYLGESILDDLKLQTRAEGTSKRRYLTRPFCYRNAEYSLFSFSVPCYR